MFTPQFRLTPTLVANLTQTERLYGQLESLRIPKKFELNLERNNLVQSSYISNSIEGNPLSLPEVTNLLLGDRVPANRDEKEVMNYFDLLKTLPKLANKPLSLQTITNLHQQLLAGVDNEIAGTVRNKRVIVGSYLTTQGELQLKVKHEPPFHARAEIEGALNELLHWIATDTSTQPVLKAGIFHHHYVYIHPFEDGNGRTCRLLTALILLQHNYQINKYFVLDDYYDLDRFEYSDMLNTADAGDKTTWLTYFTQGVKYSLQSALGKMNHALQSVGVEERPTTKEHAVLDLLRERQQLTSQDVVTLLSISRQQAHKLLSGLVDKGYAQKKGETKNSYYVLK